MSTLIAVVEKVVYGQLQLIDSTLVATSHNENSKNQKGDITQQHIAT